MVHMAEGQVSSRDGTPIAYRAAGSGPALVFTNGYSTTDTYWRYLIERFAPRARVVTWDLKGHGRSGPARSTGAVSIEDSVDDLMRVMDAAGARDAVLLGFSVGCQIILEAWRYAAEHIRGLVAVLGTYGRPFDNFIHPRVGPWLYRLLRAGGPASARHALRLGAKALELPLAYRIAQLSGLIGRGVTRRQMEPFFKGLAEIDAETWVEMGLAAQRHDAWNLLESIRVPALVIGGDRDLFTPAETSVRMAERIPGAELLLVSGAGHTGLFEFPQAIGERVQRFLEQHRLID